MYRSLGSIFLLEVIVLYYFMSYDFLLANVATYF